MKLTVRRVRRRSVLIASVVFLGLGVWMAHHAASTVAALHGTGSQFGFVFAIAFVMLVVQTVLYYLERPVTATAEQQEQLDKLHVTVPVPAYNEDPELLRRTLMSMLDQERLPNRVYVVDDGSKNKDGTPVDYSAVRKEFLREARAVGVEAKWVRTSNGGKRHAQGVVFADTPDTDIYVTVDSDAYLPRNAIDELLQPLADRKVQSVAGIVLTSNHRASLLARWMDLWMVTSQLTNRSTQSALGAVLVNSGPLAAYRADVVRDNLEAYLNETFFGRRVEFSDDSMLTLFAQLRGKTVQQPTAVVLSAMPENLSHHLRQYVRWMRGSFIRSWWRFTYLPVTRIAFWMHATMWTQMVLANLLFFTFFVYAPLTSAQSVAPYLLAAPVLLGFAQSLRYLSLRRSDETFWGQLATVALSPVATLWAMTALRLVRWYGIATCWKIKWGTRETIEVTAEPSSSPAVSDAGESSVEVLEPVMATDSAEATQRLRPVQAAPRGSLAAAAQTVRFRPVTQPAQPAQPVQAAPRGSLAAAAQTVRFRPVTRAGRAARVAQAFPSRPTTESPFPNTNGSLLDDHDAVKAASTGRHGMQGQGAPM
jgi:hyaluronan synthase